jgi:hypothetical protein
LVFLCYENTIGKKIYKKVKSALLGKKSATNKGSRSVSRFFNERPSEDLVGLREKYLRKLKKLVDECEQLFDRA